MSPLVYIYADESCLGNQYRDRDSPGGAGALIELWRRATRDPGGAEGGPGGAWERRDHWLSDPGTTNNRMALIGAADVLRLLTRPCRIIFTSDSQYLVKGMREWVSGWVRRDWKRKTGPVENRELWQALLTQAGRHRVDWRWVRGHAGHPQNEYANHLATTAAREQTASGGLVPSGYTEWLDAEREQGRYMDVFEFQAPPEEEFDPARVP